MSPHIFFAQPVGWMPHPPFKMPGAAPGLQQNQPPYALLNAGDQIVVTATSDARFLVLAAQPLNEPVVQYGPFVMNTREEIEQAINDYQSGKLVEARAQALSE